MKLKTAPLLFFLTSLLSIQFSSCPSVALSKSSVDGINLPADTGGEKTPHVLGSTDSPYGFYCYLPGGYETTAQPYPLLIFLHGSGHG